MAQKNERKNKNINVKLLAFSALLLIATYYLKARSRHLFDIAAEEFLCLYLANAAPQLTKDL